MSKKSPGNKFLLLTQLMLGGYACGEWPKYGVPVFFPFRKVNKVFRAIRRFWLGFNLPMDKIWYSSDWIANAQKSDVIVIHMNRLTMSLPRYINRLNPKAKVIAWYWNTVCQSTQPSKIRGKCECWSFDGNDCKRYGMHFNHQYYFKTLVDDCEPNEYDIFFCGSDSGRGKKLVELYRLLTDLKLKVLFKIVYPKYENIPDELKSGIVDYGDLLNYNKKSRAILELVRPGQVGATARLMECLFLKKKLITNNESVIDEPFYREDNIFVLGCRSLDLIPAFINKEYDHSVDSFIEEYDFLNWLKKFAKGNN